jgi:hypothetical protein
MSDQGTQPSPAYLGTDVRGTAAALTPERLAFLRPRLEQLLAELLHLELAVEPSLEPAFTPRDDQGEDRDAH